MDSLGISPDGSRLASAAGGYSEPGEVIVWDTQSWAEIFRVSGQTGQTSSVDFSPDGKRIAISSGEWDQPTFIKIWHIDNGNELLSIGDLDATTPCRTVQSRRYTRCCRIRIVEAHRPEAGTRNRAKCGSGCRTGEQLFILSAPIRSHSFRLLTSPDGLGWPGLGSNCQDLGRGNRPPPSRYVATCTMLPR